MLKQSLIQEKLSDLQSSSGNTQANNVVSGKLSGTKSAKTVTSTSTKDSSGTQLGANNFNNLNIARTSDSSRITSSKESLLPHMPQWPRIQIGTQQIQSNINNTNLTRGSANLLNRNYANTSTKTSPTSSAIMSHGGNRREKLNYPVNPHTNTQNPKNEDFYDSNEATNEAANGPSNENIEYDGIETVNYYSSKHYGFSGNESNNNFASNSQNSFNHKGQNTNNNNNNFGLNSNMNRSHLSFNSNITTNTYNNNNNNNSTNQNAIDNYDPTMKLRYLEKSIKFIQQQHNETLTCLHQEIENLKNENRDLHFKLATRKTSGSQQQNSGQGMSGFSANSRPSSSNKKQITNSEINLLKSINTDNTEQKGFEKLIREASKETDLNKRLNDIKQNYDQNKYDILVTKLKDAESKNEYLTNIINQLQTRRSVNSGYRPNVNVNNLNNSANANNANNSNSTNNSNNTISNHLSNNNTNSLNHMLISKLNLNNIYTIEPLLIKINEKDEPRAPNQEESESIIKKLFELYKQQKQQISNMKVVLKDMMQTENLSNQGMMMTKDILDNPNKFNQYFLDNKLSIITPITHNSNSILNQNKYHSQLLATLNTNNLDLNALKANSNLNLASSIHLPPLQTLNPAKFPERQRRTQILQKQRLRKEYFH